MIKFEIIDLRVVTVMEGTIGNAEKGSDLSIMSIFAIALKESERSDEIALL